MNRVPPDQSSRLWRNDLGLHVELHKSEVGYEIMHAAKQAIPEDIRSYFTPSDASVSLCWADIVDTFSDPKPVFLGRAYVTVGSSATACRTT